MERRRRFTTPTEALVQFEVDNKTDIVPIKAIMDESDSILEGNVVNLKYNGHQYRATIIKLSSECLLYIPAQMFRP